jgi:hypothetical protein
MKSRVELDINGPQAEVAALFADPRNLPDWMDDIARAERLSGELGETGSVYRMVPKKAGEAEFVATVVRRVLPTQVSLSLNTEGVSVAITDTFRRVSDTTTRLISEEVFSFRGRFGKLIGFVSQSMIRKAHRQHMESFKRYAERATS